MQRATNPMKQTWASRSEQRVHTPPRQFGGAMPLPGNSCAPPISGAELRSARVGAMLSRPVNAAVGRFFFFCVLFSFFFFSCFILVFRFLLFFHSFSFLIFSNTFKI
jgi:hypothetical protein